jgi:hypothetical protein
MSDQWLPTREGDNTDKQDLFEQWGDDPGARTVPFYNVLKRVSIIIGARMMSPDVAGLTKTGVALNAIHFWRSKTFGTFVNRLCDDALHILCDCLRKELSETWRFILVQVCPY